MLTPAQEAELRRPPTCREVMIARGQPPTDCNRLARECTCTIAHRADFRDRPVFCDCTGGSCVCRPRKFDAGDATSLVAQARALMRDWEARGVTLEQIPLNGAKAQAWGVSRADFPSTRGYLVAAIRAAVPELGDKAAPESMAFVRALYELLPEPATDQQPSTPTRSDAQEPTMSESDEERARLANIRRSHLAWTKPLGVSRETDHDQAQRLMIARRNQQRADALEEARQQYRSGAAISRIETAVQKHRRADAEDPLDELERILTRAKSGELSDEDAERAEELMRSLRGASRREPEDGYDPDVRADGYDADPARRRFLERQRNAWKQPMNKFSPGGNDAA